MPGNGDRRGRREGQGWIQPSATGPGLQPTRGTDWRTRARRILRPGIGIKRWLVVVFAGELLIAVAGAIALRAFVRESGAQGGSGATAVIDVLTLQFLPFEVRVTGLVVGGLVLLGYGWWRLLRVLIEPYQVRDEPLVELLYQRRVRARGPNIVAIGGGTGLSTLLRGLKELTSNITAVVTVADDGGSSGKLRTRMGVPPMGDIRNCIEALADVEPVMTRLLHYRFIASSPATGADGRAEETTPFAGHAFGNLLIAALTDISGDFEEAVRQANRVLAVRGNVVPVAGVPVTLHAETQDGQQIDGQSRIARARGVRRVWISPSDIRATQEALDAIAAADLVVIGPGSLYTSLLPPLLVPGIREALDGTAAPRLFVCNVATQVGETEGYTLSAHLAALEAHGVGKLIDAVLVNGNFQARQPANYPAAPVVVDVPLSGRQSATLLTRDVVDDDNAHRHDSHKLATTILELHDERVIQRRDRVAVTP